MKKRIFTVIMLISSLLLILSSCVEETVAVNIDKNGGDVVIENVTTEETYK